MIFPITNGRVENQHVNFSGHDSFPRVFLSLTVVNGDLPMVSKVPTNLPPHMNVKFIKKYLGLGDLARARQLFDSILKPDVLSWTALISAYTRMGQCEEAIKLYTEIRDSRKVIPDKFVILAAAKTCANSGDLIKAKQIHGDAVMHGYGSDLILGNALIDMYGKCKYLSGAERVFDELCTKDVISWTSFCSCYVACGLPEKALSVFREMGSSKIMPNAMTLSTVIPACSSLKSLNWGREIHGFVIKNGMEDNKFVNCALVDMYANCASIKNAEVLFHNMPNLDTVSWNVIISAYFSNGEFCKALSKFRLMRSQGVLLNATSWNTVIAGCIDSGKPDAALDLFGEMQQLGSEPNQITLTSVLTACAHSENLRQGKEIHVYFVRRCIFEDLVSSTALVLMYAKCGGLEASHRIFSMMSEKDTVAWNTIIIANSMHGRGEEALSLFRKMIDSGAKPNSVTFTGVLSGCSHSQMVDEGITVFDSMSKNYEVEPDSEHYSCIVDVLGRAGCLAEAYKFIQKMPVEPSASAWGALLGACRIYKNVDLARIAANHLFEIEPNNPGNYVLFFNILVTARLWSEASEIRKLMRDRGVRKVPGCSWVEVNNRFYTFVVGDKDNDQIVEIYEFLDDIRRKMKLAGYFPVTEFVLQDLDGEEKEVSLCNHSEKLAVAFGILNLKGQSSIRVFKNLRICGDCHDTIKYISKTVGVKIIMRDSLRFHHFADGLCSCKDFW
ncbi:pentatricopeptide repeat-containing protein chloroplastic-like [Dorcoceras hygrometricum]|uniref:Pentatricopeptide repeat-containing protein chloroplastic-like n=1 Tax=Dorcoceras hygrometricum TaxID=472368 RepID=A0A2Z7ATS4_9LAMI|nr:pentatricopeptide repeat-containing protein chloroplastic-like [Dorcoceras hygrometricum]